MQYCDNAADGNDLPFLKDVFLEKIGEFMAEGLPFPVPLRLELQPFHTVSDRAPFAFLPM